MAALVPYPLSRFIAHRGGGALAPENTLAGFRLAPRLGYRAVEFDVMLAKDGVPVVIHDDTLVRTTGRDGNVPDFTAADLQARDAGGRFHRAFAGEPLPTFAQVMALCVELGLQANIEIKPAPGHEAETGRVVAELTRQHWSAGLPVLLSSFDEVALAAAAKAAPGLPRASLFNEIPDDWAERLQAMGSIALHCHHSQITTPNGQAVFAAGVAVAVYTVNTTALADQCWQVGVSAIFTDRLDLFPG